MLKYLKNQSSPAAKLLDRLDVYYVNGPLKDDGTRGRVAYPSTMWSLYRRVIEGSPLTTNFLEGDLYGFDFDL